MTKGFDRFFSLAKPGKLLRDNQRKHLTHFLIYFCKLASRR